MALMKSQKEEIVKKFRKSELDTGSSEVQVALMTAHIRQLTEHFKRNKNDVHGRRGLLKLVNRRRKLLDYLRAQDPKRYATIISALDIRK